MHGRTTKAVIAMFVAFVFLAGVGIVLNDDVKDVKAGGGSGPNNYTKIQDAIDNATDGDTIFVYNGTYKENIIINRSIILIGENRNTTIIDGERIGDVVNISANGVTIQGFTIRNSTSSWIQPYAGIKIYSSYNNLIYNCSINNNNEGISLDSSYNNSIYNCNISNNGWKSIALRYSYNNLIYNCNIRDNEWEIYFYYSNNNSIRNCNISNNWNDGIELYYSNNNSIRNCNIINNIINTRKYGIEIDSSSNNEIYNCNFINGGVAIWGDKLSHFIHNIYNNTVNGKPLLYYKNEKNVILDGIEAGEIILANCSDFEIKNMNISNSDIAIEITISNNNKIYACNISNNNNEGISLDSSYNNSIYNCDSSYNNSIYNCSINDNNEGISLDSSYNNSIYNCSINDNLYGIAVCHSYNNSIYNCSISNNHAGIGLYSSRNCTIINNTMWNDGVMISGKVRLVKYWNTHIIDISNTINGKPLYYWKNVKGGTIPAGVGQIILANCTGVIIENQNLSNTSGGIELGFSSNCTITTNIISNNNFEGVYLEYSDSNIIINNTIDHNDNGIRLFYGSSNTIVNNNISNSSNDGIFVIASGNIITTNNISNNDFCGIQLSSSHNNLIYNNYFNNYFCNAWDNTHNVWNISKTAGTNIVGGPYLGGNYWSDYTGVDTDGDGIGDTDLSYNSSGGIMNGGDCLPLVMIANSPPTANFTWIPTNPTDLDVITFTDSSSDSDGIIVNWTWNFGDGNISYEQNPAHQYADDGVYNVTLTVTDDDGATDTFQKSIAVSNVPPNADFSWSPSNPTTADTIQFTDSSSDSDGSIVSISMQMMELTM